MNYKQLAALHVKYAEAGLRIMAFPCNQFGSQEPGSESEIKDFAAKYDAKFQMFSKVRVNGDKALPLYRYLKIKRRGALGNFIKWNFTKFLIARDGTVVERFSPNESPMDLLPKIKMELDKTV